MDKRTQMPYTLDKFENQVEKKSQLGHDPNAKPKPAPKASHVMKNLKDMFTNKTDLAGCVDFQCDSSRELVVTTNQKEKIAAETKSTLTDYDFNMYTLSDFVIGSSIGEGRFARVHEASLQKRPVALRVIKLNEAAAISNKKLIAQAKALCSVEHKNIVKCFGALVGETKGFVLELCGKKIYDMFEEVTVRSLHGLLQILENDISLEWRLKALLDVSDGLNYLHDKSIVAGDVKPSNILICGEVENDITFKIADYSVQSILQQQTSLMMSSYGAGKAEAYSVFYMAPEMLTSECGASIDSFTTQTDMFSFSIMAYQIMFPSSVLPMHITPFQHMIALKNHWCPSIPALKNELFKKVHGLIELCWFEQPAKRSSAKTFNSDLRYIIENTSSLSPKKGSNEVIQPATTPSMVNEKTKEVIECSNTSLLKNCERKEPEPAIESTSTPACNKKSKPVTTSTPLLKKFGEKLTEAVIENTITSSANNFTDQDTAKSDECMLSDDDENYFVPIKKPTIKEIIKACRPVASSENSEKSAAASQENEVNCSSLEQSVVNDSGLHGDFPTIINTDVEDLDVSGVVDQVDCVDDPEDSDYTLSETEVSESEDSEISDKENKHVEKGADVFTFSADEEDESEEEQETIDRVYVKETQKSNGGERLYDSRHACLYCGLMQPKLSRHLLTHIVEEEVKKVKDLALKSKERKHLLKALRLKGDFYHNIKVLKTGGEMIVARRPPKGVKSQPSEYLPCKYCYAFLHQAQLSRHCRNCSFKDMKSCEQENIIKQSELLIYPNRAIPGASLDLEEFVIRKMKKDELTELVKKDFIIVTYGSFLISGKGRRATGEVSQRMRILARLLQKLQELRQNVDGGLIAFIKPQYFDDVCECTKLLAGYKSQNADGEMAPCFETPSLPLKLGYTLDSVCNLLHGYGLRTNDDVLIKNAINFLKLYQTEWPVRISSASLRTLAENKFNKTDVLPLTSDLLKLKVFCEKEIVRLCADLKKNVTVDVWRQLAEIVITRLTVFNKRRGNEPASILLKRYAARHDREKIMHDDIADSLSPIEKKLIDRLEIVHVRGKRGRQVPTLLTADCVAAIDLLVKKREKVGVAAGNKYLFPTPTRQSLNPLRGYQCINEVVKRVEGLEKPDLVKSTKLRKYIATVAQVMHLENHELEWLAGHLGHDVNVHKEYYRLHDSAIELSKVSRLLLAIDSGNGKELVGRSLKEITLNDLPSPVDEDLNEEDVNEEDLNEEDVEHFSDHENTAVSETRKIVKIIAPRKSNRNWTQWSKEASAVVLKRCHSFIVGDLLPGKALCEKIIEENQGLLQGRSWRNIKDFVRNHKRNVSKKMSEK